MLFTSHNGGKIDFLTVKSQICSSTDIKAKSPLRQHKSLNYLQRHKKVKITNKKKEKKCILSEGKRQNCFQGGGNAKGSWCARRSFSASTYKRHLYWPQHLGAQDYCQESDMNIMIWCSSDWNKFLSQHLQAPPILETTFVLFFVKTLVISFLVSPPIIWGLQLKF